MLSKLLYHACTIYRSIQNNPPFSGSEISSRDLIAMEATHNTNQIVKLILQVKLLEAHVLLNMSAHTS